MTCSKANFQFSSLNLLFLWSFFHCDTDPSPKQYMISTPGFLYVVHMNSRPKCLCVLLYNE